MFPQGSVLGQLFCLIYINDIYSSSDKVRFISFTGDTTVFQHGNNIENMATDLNSDLNKICLKVKSKKIYIHGDKPPHVSHIAPTTIFQYMK